MIGECCLHIPHSDDDEDGPILYRDDEMEDAKERMYAKRRVTDYRDRPIHLEPIRTDTGSY